MKRLGFSIIAMALVVSLCMGFSWVLADDTDAVVYKTSGDGQFKYHVVDWSGDGSDAYAVLDEYLGSKSTLDIPESIDGYDILFGSESEKFFKSMKTVTTVVFQKPVLGAAFTVFAPKLQSIQVDDFGNTGCFIYDGCLYGPYYFDSSDKSTVISECMMWGAPGGKETINLYKDVDDINADLEAMENLKSISISEENKKYKTVDGVLLNKEGAIIGLPNKYSPGKTVELPSGIKKSIGRSYSKWEKVVFPEGLEEYTAPEESYWYGDYDEPDKQFSHDELVDVLSSEGTKILVFPSTLTKIGYETRNTVWIEGEDEHGFYGYRYISTRIEKSVKDIYLNMSQEKANNSIQLNDQYSDDEYKINRLDEFFAFYYPNATIHYTHAVKVTSTNNGTVSVKKDSELAENTVEITLKPDNGYQLNKLTVTDKKGKEVKVTDNKFIMPDSDVTITAEFEKISSGNQDGDNKDNQKDEDKTPVATTYTDVPTSGKWYSDAVYYATAKGYMAGTGNNKFSPDATVTRGTIAQILYAAEGKPAVSGKSQFVDVGETKWYAKAVKWAADKGLVSGYGNGKFGPEDRITREQMVAIMMQYSKMKGYDTTASADLSKFADQKDISKWAVNAVKWGISHKIVSGTGKGIEPKGNATRAQIAVILQAYDNNVRK